MLNHVAVLCCAINSEYKSIPFVDCYDERRGAYAFSGGKPVIAHPPCRLWSRMRYRAKCANPAAEKDLGIWCCHQVIRNGGIVEQPRRSLLFSAAGLPRPGESSCVGFSLEVYQSWWGYPLRKPTWLFFKGIDKGLIDMPFSLREPRGDGRRFELMSKRQRSYTTRDFALWLVDLARRCQC